MYTSKCINYSPPSTASSTVKLRVTSVPTNRHTQIPHSQYPKLTTIFTMRSTIFQIALTGLAFFAASAFAKADECTSDAQCGGCNEGEEATCM